MSSKNCNATSGAEQTTRRHWRAAEDLKLRTLVATFGPHHWKFIAEHLQGRSGRSCRERWLNKLDPRINNESFSEEEEEKLLAAQKEHGNKWAMIVRSFPGRTDTAIKNHWHLMMARRQKEESKGRTLSDSTCTCPDLSIALTPCSSSSGMKIVDNVTSLTPNGFHFPEPEATNPRGLDHHHNSQVSAHQSVSATTAKMSPPGFIDFLGVGTP